jgi:hypothetical protein
MDSSIPPLPPPCDLDCQKQKQLALLKKKLDDVDPEKDPAGYQKARIAYFTLLNGPGWLAQEKHRIASQEVEPVLKTYQKQYDSLKGEQQTHGVFKNLADSLKAKSDGDEKGNTYLNRQLMLEKDKAETADRLNQLNAGTPYTPPETNKYISWAIDILIAILGLFVLYKVYTRFFGQVSMSPAVPDLTST